jgi:predicted dehydrogenase
MTIHIAPILDRRAPFVVAPQAIATSTLKTAIIGSEGQQGQEYKEILSDHVDLIGFVDTAYTGLMKGRYFPTLEALLSHVTPDLILVSLPHYLHFAVTSKLLKAGIHVIKDKPLAISRKEVMSYKRIMKLSPANLFTFVQRAKREVLLEGKTRLNKLGTPYWFQYEYSLALPSCEESWRSYQSLCGGVCFLIWAITSLM